MTTEYKIGLTVLTSGLLSTFLKLITQLVSGKRRVLMFSFLETRSRSTGSNPDRGYCVVFLGETL